MTTWSTFHQAEPELAARARAVLSSTTNCVLGTLRADGSPRLSGIDPWFSDGELCFGSMPGSRKGQDLARDPRLALHAVPWESRRRREGADDPGEADAKVTGTAVLLSPTEGHQLISDVFAARGIDHPPEGDVYRIALATVVVVSVVDDQLVIDRWSADHGRQVVHRS